MDITITISASELTEVDINLIKNSLGLDEDQMSDAFQKICKSAFMEYMKMFKEKGLPTRADEVQQERLYFLLNYYYENTLPSESEISSIFQLTQSQSKTLLRNTKSKYRNKINTLLKNTLKSTLDRAALGQNEDYVFICTSPSTVEEMNLIIAQKGPELKSIEKMKGLASKYTCAIDTYDLLKHELR